MNKQVAQSWLDEFYEAKWHVTKTYSSDSKHYTCKSDDGWTAHVNLRDMKSEDNRVHVWAPDQLAVMVTDLPCIAHLEAARRYCIFCDTHDVDTVRISFAGRCCEECRNNEELIKKMEYPGWAN